MEALNHFPIIEFSMNVLSSLQNIFQVFRSTGANAGDEVDK